MPEAFLYTQSGLFLCVFTHLSFHKFARPIFQGRVATLAIIAWVLALLKPKKSGVSRQICTRSDELDTGALRHSKGQEPNVTCNVHENQHQER